MQIVYFPHPALRFQAAPVQRIDGNLRSVVRRMFDLMYTAQGIGLAANQIGLPLRVFVMNLNPEDRLPEDEHVFINPRILHRRGSEVAEEGCLSIPKLFADVRRPSDIVVEAFDLDGQGFEMELDDLPARCVQHEVDHLDGVLFTDKVLESQLPEVAPVLNVFEDAFRNAQQATTYPDEPALKERLRSIAATGAVPADFLESNLATPEVTVPAVLLRPRKGRGKAE
jgi:peptide deformylase